MDDVIWDTCTRCKKEKSAFKLRGYFYAEALCESCIKPDEVKCDKCEKLFGYIRRGASDTDQYVSGVACPDCVKIKIKSNVSNIKNKIDTNVTMKEFDDYIMLKRKIEASQEELSKMKMFEIEEAGLTPTINCMKGELKLI